MIQSIHNPKLKFARLLLSRKKEREDADMYVLEGIRLIEAAVQTQVFPEFVLYTEQISVRAKKLIEQLQTRQVECLEVEEHILGRISDTEQSQGIIAVSRIAHIPEPAVLDFVLILDGIRDPGNMGTILRTAASAGIQSVWVSNDCVDHFSPKVLRAGMGAQFQLPIVQRSWEQISADAKTHRLKLWLANSNGGSVLWQADFISPTGLLVCNEAQGPSDQARGLSAQTIHIPMPGQFESLNAAVAASILIYEVVRQRMNI